jgi:ribonuclease III
MFYLLDKTKGKPYSLTIQFPPREICMKKNKTERALFKEFQAIIGYTFKNSSLLSLALTHSSYKNEKTVQHTSGVRKTDEDNERFEFLGDTVLSFVISRRLFVLFKQVNEGELSKYRSVLVSREILFLIAKKIKMNRFIKLGQNEAKGTVKEKVKLLANAVEAIIAAIYFDGGLKNAEKFILDLWGPYLEKKKLARLDKNYKSALQELSQKTFKMLPFYHTIAENNQFKATVSMGKDLHHKAVGYGRNKRDAEQEAAKNLLKLLKK